MKMKRTLLKMHTNPGRLSGLVLALLIVLSFLAYLVIPVQAGVAGTALAFTGSTEYAQHVTFGTAAGLGVTTFTLEAWVKRAAGGVAMSTGTLGFDGVDGRPNGIYPAITKGMDEGDDATANLNINYFLGITVDGTIGADFEDSTDGSNHPVWGSTVVAVGDWHHIAATYNGNCWVLYLDGDAETMNGDTCPNTTPESGSIQHAALAAGLDSNGTPGAGFFAGVIDEAHIWNQALSQTDIQNDLYSQLTSGTGLLASWEMNEGSGTTVGDPVSGIDGTVQSAVSMPLPAWVDGFLYNEAPTDINLSTNTTAENQAIGSIVGTLSTTDPDSGDTFTYALVAGEGSADNASFNISGENLRTSEVFNYETKNSYSIRVQTTDSGDESVQKTFTILVTDVNDIPVITETDPQAVTMSEDSLPTPFDLTLNAADEDGDTLTWSILTQATNGTATVSGTGASKAIGYAPTANYHGSDSFVVQVSDGNGGTDTLTVNVTINAVNDAPVITETDPQAVTMSEDGSPTPFDLTLNATDADGDTLTWSILTQETNGTATAAGTGASKAIGYAPTANYHGSDSFVVQVSDGNGGTDTITVNVTINAVNDAPVITETDPQAVTMSEDGSPTPFDLTLNATDADGDTLTWSILTQATNGTATAAGTGASKVIGYAPIANYHGSDSFVVQVSDGNGGTDTLTVNVTINAVNDAPVITETDPQAVTMSEDGSPTLFDLTLNATDADGDTLTWSILTQATNGTATAVGTGASKAIGYAPTANYHGSDSFVVQVSDGNGGTATLTVNVTILSVNDIPVITETNPQAVTMSEDGSPTLFDLTLNATDADGDTLTWSILTQATNGTATAAGTGASKVIGYAPIANYHGSDSFVVQVSDGNGGTDTLTVNVTILSVNDIPVITETNPQAVTMSEDSSPAPFDLTLNATDADGDTLTWSILTQATNGTATAVGTGASKAIGYAPTANYHGSDSFVVQVSDGNGGSDTLTVNVTINAVNDAPVITEGTSVGVVMSENSTPTPFSLTLHATDVDGNTITWSISTPASHGTATASGTGASKTIGYTPTVNYSGSDSFVVQVSDGNGGTDTITVNVTISDVTYTISGNAQVAGTTIVYVVDSTPMAQIADGTGNFTLTVPSGWSGDLTPSKTGYTFIPSHITYSNVLANQTGANFTATLNSYSLIISKTGSTGTGTVTSIPAGINCGADCSEYYLYGTSVTLTATPTAGDYDRFQGWSGGGCSGTGTCTVVLAASTEVTAMFEKATFEDVPFDYTETLGGVDYLLYPYIEALWDGNFTAGCGTDPLTYCPDRTMNRGESSVFILRGNFGTGYVPPIEPWDTFADDWTPGPWAEKWAEGMWDEMMTAGCQLDPLKFCPWYQLPRVEGAVFGLRLKYGASYTPPAATGQVFADMTDAVGYWGTKWAEKAYADGLLPACGTGEGGKPNFCPYDLLDRAWSAYMIVTAKGLPLP